MAATVAIGIFTDRRDIYDIGIEYFKHGAGNGSIYNAIPFLHPGALALWQESGRDQPHTQLGIGLMASTAEMAWNQGDDLYGFANNRFMYAAEYIAKYNNRDDNVPFATYEWGTSIKGDVRWQTGIPSSGRGGARPVWEMIYNHYANRKGLSVPNIDALAQLLRPEGAPNNTHPLTFDHRPAGSDGTATLSDENIPDGTYRFIVRHTGKVMDAAGTSNGANILQWSYHGGTNQQWNVTGLKPFNIGF